MHTFAGILDTNPGASHSGFRVKVYVDDTNLEIVSTDGEKWGWKRAKVDVGRVRADQFRLSLDGEQLYFSPDDPISFMLNAQDEPNMPTEKKQGWLRQRLEMAMSDGVPAEEPTYDAVPSEDSGAVGRFGFGRSNHHHEWVESTAGRVIRRRCTTCGHISIDVSGVGSDLAAQMAATR